jgi:Xaa-Pro dipeptidase
VDISPRQTLAAGPPFDAAKLDKLMEEAGIDVLLATSKHNTQYLLGGYKFIFFAAMDAIGHSRYLPIVVYEKGSPDHSAYIGNRMEGGEHQNNPFWTPAVHTATWGTLDAAALAVEHLRKIGKSGARIGIEWLLALKVRVSWRRRIRSSDCARSRHRKSWRSSRLPPN